MYLTIYLQGSKRLCGVLLWEGVRDRTELQYIDPHSYGRQRCVILVLRGCSTGGTEAHSPGWWLSLHLISIFSGPQFNRGPRAPSAWCGFPYPIWSITAWLLSWLSYIIVQRPLSCLLDLWNRMFWSSSSGNNCHAVHRSLSSGASVYECTMGIFFTSSHFFSQFPPTGFPLITAIRMCYLLPVHHLGMAFLAGSKAKIQHNPSAPHKYISVAREDIFLYNKMDMLN